MAKTIISGASAYAAYTDLFKLVDARIVADWISTDGDRVGKIDDNTVNEATVGASSKVTNALAAASGDIEAAVFRGNKNTAADLTALSASSTNGAAALKKLVCGLALITLAGHRLAEDKRALGIAQEANEKINRLNDGTEILPFEENAEAGKIAHSRQTPSDILENNGMAVQYDRYFGRTSDRTPNPYRV